MSPNSNREVDFQNTRGAQIFWQNMTLVLNMMDLWVWCTWRSFPSAPKSSMPPKSTNFRKKSTNFSKESSKAIWIWNNSRDYLYLSNFPSVCIYQEKCSILSGDKRAWIEHMMPKLKLLCTHSCFLHFHLFHLSIFDPSTVQTSYKSECYSSHGDGNCAIKGQEL